MLLDPFQQYLEMSVVCGLSICAASEKNCSFGNGNVLLEFFSGGGLGWNSDNKVGLQVIAEKMNICSYFRVGKCPYLQDFS